ncbi:MAG: tetratricopeptide repeat protein [Phycisphaeraceae bacterium]
MGLFSNWKKSSSDEATEPKPAKNAPARDPKKARRFFEHAQAVADSRNYDYAVECYINGLRHDPESMQHHEALRDVSLRRKVNGGKAPSLKEQFKYSGGKGALEKMLNAEYLWAKDPFSAQLGLTAMEAAVKSSLPEVAYWLGGFVLENGRAAKRPSKALFLKARDLFTEIGAYDQAVEACSAAASLDPGNNELLNELKNLEAELTLMVGRYGEGGSFRSGIKDSDKQRALEQDESISNTESAQNESIARARAAYEESPEDMDLLFKLVRALAQKETEEAENEAITFLHKAHQQTGQYRYKSQVGDLRMKQYNRRVRQIRQAIAKADGEQRTKLQQQLKHTLSEQVKFELKEYAERAKNYPTDMGVRFNLGRRQFVLGDNDAAIANFQEAQSDPKNRPWALRYLGEAFARKEWLDEAIDTFHRGIEVHPYADDRLALELRYELMKVLEAKADRDDDLTTAQEATKVASQIAQIDINYKDIRERMDSARALVNRIKKANA